MNHVHGQHIHVWDPQKNLEMIFEVIHVYQTQEGYPNTKKRIENTMCMRVFFDKSVWIADETLSRVFVSSESKQQLRSKQRVKIIKICAD